jgi:hypothetical protein
MSATELGTEREVAVLVTSNGRQEMQLGRNSYNFNHLTGGADGTRTRPESNEISNLLYPKEGESPFDPYDPRISHQISHYLGKPSPRSAYPESRRPSPKHSLM